MAVDRARANLNEALRRGFGQLPREHYEHFWDRNRQ